MRRLIHKGADKTVLLQTQVFSVEDGKKVLLSEPRLEAREGVPATISAVHAQGSGIQVSFREVPPDQLTATCSQLKGRPITASQLEGAIAKIDGPSDAGERGCCGAACGGNVGLQCCGVLCCGVSSTCGCCVEP